MNFYPRSRGVISQNFSCLDSSRGPAAEEDAKAAKRAKTREVASKVLDGTLATAYSASKDVEAVALGIIPCEIQYRECTPNET